MPVEINWYSPQRVIFVRYTGNISADEMQYLAQNALAMLESAPPDIMLVHSLYDFSALEKMPLNLKLASDTAAPAYSNPRMGWVAAYGLGNVYVKYLAQMVGQMFKLRYRFFDTQEEAVQFLQSVDMTLPVLPLIAD